MVRSFLIKSPTELTKVITMQFGGGYKYPSLFFCILITSLAGIITLGLWSYKNLNPSQVLALFLNLEGTVLLASAFTPVGLTPPNRGIIKKLGWFLKQQGGVPVSYNQVMFYGGLLCLFMANVISALGK